MRRLLAISICLCATALALPAHGETLDRIVAVVNNTPILLSDWDESWRCEALLADRAPESYTQAEQQDVFQRLVEQELLHQQMHSYLLSPIAGADQQAALKEVREQLGDAADAQWKAALNRAGITEAQLSEHLKRQMEIERFVDVRFRAGIRIDERSIAHYYRDQFLPQLRHAGGKDVPLDEVSSKIREILVQQQMAEQLTAWVQTLREQADITIPPPISNDSNEIEITQSQ
jgi:parvulin-like peptidyl-prolyl isomerase